MLKELKDLLSAYTHVRVSWDSDPWEVVEVKTDYAVMRKLVTGKNRKGLVRVQMPRGGYEERRFTGEDKESGIIDFFLFEWPATAGMIDDESITFTYNYEVGEYATCRFFDHIRKNDIVIDGTTVTYTDDPERLTTFTNL